MLDPDPDEMNADPQPCFFSGIAPVRTLFVRHSLSPGPTVLVLARGGTPGEFFLYDWLIDR
jgi:hypothetical protein